MSIKSQISDVIEVNNTKASRKFDLLIIVIILCRY